MKCNKHECLQRTVRRMSVGVVAILSFCSFGATEVVDGIEWTYRIVDGEARVGVSGDDYDVTIGWDSLPTAIPKSSAGAIVIPRTLGGCRVTEIRESAFYGCTNITSVTIPSCVRNFMDNCDDDAVNCFQKCSSLREIVVEQGNETWESRDGVLFRRYVAQTGDPCSRDLAYETRVALMAYPCGRQGDYAIPSDVNEISHKAFCGCVGLTSVSIPSGVRHMRDDWCLSFADCSCLTNIAVETANERYFSYEGSLFAMYGNTTNLLACPGGRSGKYEVPSFVEEVNAHAFNGCGKLTSIAIPAAVKSFAYDSNPFVGCASLTSVEVSAQNRDYWSVDGVLFCKSNWHDKNGRTGTTVTLVAYPAGKCGSYEIPPSVTEIGASAFWGCKSLRSITLPPSLSWNGDSSGWFEGCSGLERIDVAAGNAELYSTDGVLFARRRYDEFVCVEMIAYPPAKGGPYTIPSGLNDYSFRGCGNLTSVCIPSGEERLWSATFVSCHALTAVTIPSSVKEIDERAICDCPNLREIDVETGDEERVKSLFASAGYDVSRLTFVGIGPSSDFSGESKCIFNGLVRDADGVMCGIIQVVTAKITKNGEVKVSGFVMLEDGKKQALKVVSGKIVNGLLKVTTKVGKIGDMELIIGGNGFSGKMGVMSVSSEPMTEDAGVVKGTLTLNYFDSKSGKVKTKKIAISGVSVGDEASGMLTIKGQMTKRFQAEIGE